VGEKSEKKPLLTIRGKETYLSVWVSGNSVKMSVSKRGDQGFVRVDSYMIPLDYMLFKIFESSKDVLKRYCEFVASVEEVEDKEE